MQYDPFPHDDPPEGSPSNSGLPGGGRGCGLYVNTLPGAFAVAAVCLILFLLFNYAMVGRPGPMSSNLRA